MIPRQALLILGAVGIQTAGRALQLPTMWTIVLVFLYLALATKFLGSTEETAALVGKPAPSIATVKFVQGEAVSIEKQVTVVEFWATWCPPCRDAIPHLNKVYKHFKSRGVNFVGISQEAEKPVMDFIAKLGSDFTYPVALDIGGEVNKAYGVKGIPAAFVVSDGQVVWAGHPRSGLEAALERAIGSTSPKDADKKD